MLLLNSEVVTINQEAGTCIRLSHILNQADWKDTMLSQSWVPLKLNYLHNNSEHTALSLCPVSMIWTICTAHNVLPNQYS